MKLNEYQTLTGRTAIYPKMTEVGTAGPALYPSLGLAGEAGEVAGKVKKALRDDSGDITPERRDQIKKELGDVMWYVAQTASALDLSLEDICNANLDKLMDRKDRNMLQGDGDDR